MLLDKRCHGMAIDIQGLDSSFLTIIHEATVSNNIGVENGGEFTFKTLFCHNSTSFLKVSNKGTQYVDFRRIVKIRSE
jgi:hypothetical protein